MYKVLKKLSFIIFLGITSCAFAQRGEMSYKAIDAYVKKLGKLDSLNMGTITAIVTKPFVDKKDKARAIFAWIAFNISYDCKNGRTGNTQKNSVTEVLQNRKAVGIGFASLFQDMCSSANIRCLTADGFTKSSPEQIEDTKTDINHSWAVVQLGQSPEEWYYVDPAWGSGITDAEMKVFTPFFNDAYFFAEKAIFNWQHYPDNEAWKLGPAPKNKKDFYALPVIKVAAYEYKLASFYPSTGHIATRADKIQSFVFKLDSTAAISKISLVKGERKKQQEEETKYSFENGTLRISCKFSEGSSYPLTVKVNGKELITYMVDVE